ncbi:armadillo-type protein [Scheffersomyces coipomensis]|uniref:armadillo-type protein n=1 Tax=Scheffersomyces coipomensis TaxID=1788519 RepID=UPI00315D1BEF
MEQQIQSAVDIALSGTANPNLKTQAFEFINQIKSTEEGYKSCVEILLKSTTSSINEGLKFFVYQVIDENIEKLSSDQLFTLNTHLFEILAKYISNNVSDPIYLKNKLSQIFAKLFCYVYVNVYPSFIKDLHSIISSNDQYALDYYTRIIIGIHYEIGDKLTNKSQEILDRNTILKDTVRVNDMNALVSVWAKILTNTSNSSQILNNTLAIVGQYISWMEIGLFISNDFINSIFQFLNKKDQRNETCGTLIEIISKKMKPSNKLELISLLNLTSVINSIDASEDDIDFDISISKLVNQVGIELLIVLENDQTLFTPVQDQFFKLWPLAFNFLSHEYDDVSQEIFSFIQQYLLLGKKISGLVSIELMSTLLNKVILKMKYDENSDGIDDDEDEQFLEIRAKLKTFQDTIAVLKPDLYLEAIPVVINESVFKTTNDWRRIELGLFELNNFSDSLRNNLINVPKNEINQSKPYSIFQEFLIKLINSNIIIENNHPKVQIEFFEIIVKHYIFLTSQSNQHELVVRILEIFTSPFGLTNENERVRLRSWYLFFRFIKLTKPSSNSVAFVENIISKLRPLMVVKAELPTTDEDGNVVDNGNFNNQLNLFESIGLLIALLNNENLDQKLRFIDMVFEPLFNDLDQCIRTSDAATQPLVALQAHHSLMAIGTFAKGYDHDQIKVSPQVTTKISNAAEVELITLENFSKHEIIRDAARFSFARFIPILKSQINVHLTKLVSLFLAANNLRIVELSEFLSFVGQIVHNYKNDENMYQLLNNLLTPLVNKIFEILSTTVTDNQHTASEKNQLKRAFMNFLSSIVINNSSSLLVTETNKQKFPDIVNSLFDFAYDLGDATTSKLAITQLINIVNIFGDKGKISDKDDKYGNTLPAIEGIEEFLMSKVCQVSFELPFQKQEFDLKDAQYRLMGQEIALLLKSYQQRKPDEFTTYLSGYLTNMGLSQELMSEFCSNLVSSDIKQFKKYFIGFVTKIKGK